MSDKDDVELPAAPSPAGPGAGPVLANNYAVISIAIRLPPFPDRGWGVLGDRRYEAARVGSFCRPGRGRRRLKQVRLTGTRAGRPAPAPEREEAPAQGGRQLWVRAGARLGCWPAPAPPLNLDLGPAGACFRSRTWLLARQAPAFGAKPGFWSGRRLLSVQNLALGPAGAGFRCRTLLSAARFWPRNGKKRAENQKAPPKRRQHALVTGREVRRTRAIRPVGAPDAVPSACDCFYLSGRGVAQLVAHLLWEQEAAGSSPASPTKSPCKSRKGTLNHCVLLDGIVRAFQTVA